MDEMDALRQMRTALAQEEHPDRLALRTAWRSDPAPRRRRRGFTIPLVSVAATAAAAVTAVAVLAPGGSGDGVAPGHGGRGAASGNVLLAAATSAEKAPTGRYWHTETVIGQIYGVGKSAANSYEVDARQRSITWVGQDGKGSLAIVDELGHPVAAKDMIKWRQAGSPEMVDVPNPDGTGVVTQVEMSTQASRSPRTTPARPFDGDYFGLSAEQVAQLPTDAKALENTLLNLRGNWHAVSSTPEKQPIRSLRGAERTRALSEVASTLLSKAPAPPRVRAAAFRMLATLPGVKVGGTATDPMGRTGGVVSMPMVTTMPLGLYTAPKQLGTYERQWIIDPAGGRLLAIRDLVATPPHGSRALPPGDDGRPRRLRATDMPDRFLKTGEVASYQVFAVAEWTNTAPR
ncbi:CU044_5270 family protein [Actinoallomurus iriomotensis]|uniref:CU044_5270 family protein n=1 Tax=Actinoallomurus iriomotensis TaxID=478107 RepID=A0A9W6RII3_9ACTN|nr:CU044_5270 family protein [Actinoallomurus iriomotensis]GLY76706.1 hypothetical protein Airi01_049730 [Actinoallomurus iriomotensis]